MSRRWRRVWLLGYYLTAEQLVEAGPGAANWVLEGIFSTRARAVAVGKRGWFVASMPFGRPFAPGEVLQFPDFEWLEDLT